MIKIIDAMLVLSIIVAIIFVLWFAFSNPEPTTEQVALVLVVPVYLFIFQVYHQLTDKLTATKDDLQKELGEVKQTLAKIQGRLKI